MNDAEAFELAIRQNPDDETVRLVYADWLEENGQRDRAVHIRTGICTHFNRIRWFGRAVSDGSTQLIIWRGYVREVRCPISRWLWYADELIKQPLKRVTCYGKWGFGPKARHQWTNAERVFHRSYDDLCDRRDEGVEADVMTAFSHQFPGLEFLLEVIAPVE